MSSPTHGTLVVLGSGPGIGRNVAALFAERGFAQVILMSRDEARLQEDASFVTSAAPAAKVEIVRIDLADTESVQTALDEVDRRLEGSEPLECVLFNAARIGVSPILEFGAEDLERDLKISVVSMYKCAQWALPHLLKNKSPSSSSTPSFLVTSGMLYKDPFPQMFSLATCKAAQYNLVHSLHKEFEPKGVHCGLIVVGGRVSDESKVTTARNVAEETWKLFGQEREKGELDVVMLDPDYLKHIKQREQTKA